MDLTLYYRLWFSRSVLSDSLRLHGLQQHTRLLCPLVFPRVCSSSQVWQVGQLDFLPSRNIREESCKLCEIGNKQLLSCKGYSHFWSPHLHCGWRWGWRPGSTSWSMWDVYLGNPKVFFSLLFLVTVLLIWELDGGSADCSSVKIITTTKNLLALEVTEMQHKSGISGEMTCNLCQRLITVKLFSVFSKAQLDHIPSR